MSGMNKKKKVKVFERDGRICQRCYIPVHIVKKQEVTYESRRAKIHHIQPTSEGGTDGLYNLLLTCVVCEKEHHGVGVGKIKNKKKRKQLQQKARAKT